jgi:hypothetical protein
MVQPHTGEWQSVDVLGMLHAHWLLHNVHTAGVPLGVVSSQYLSCVANSVCDHVKMGCSAAQGSLLWFDEPGLFPLMLQLPWSAVCHGDAAWHHLLLLLLQVACCHH